MSFAAAMRSQSSRTTCSRLHACRSAPPSSISARWLNTGKHRRFSPIPRCSGPRTTSPAATAKRGMTMQQASGHTLKAFDQDIERLRALISQMGGLAEHAIGESMRCLVNRDLEGAEKIVINDKK